MNRASVRFIAMQPALYESADDEKRIGGRPLLITKFYVIILHQSCQSIESIEKNDDITLSGLIVLICTHLFYLYLVSKTYLICREFWRLSFENNLKVWINKIRVKWRSKGRKGRGEICTIPDIRDKMYLLISGKSDFLTAVSVLSWWWFGICRESFVNPPSDALNVSTALPFKIDTSLEEYGWKKTISILVSF